jgi:hypothetical protein
VRALIRRFLQLDPPAAPLPAPPKTPSSSAARAAARVKRQLELESRVDFLELEVNKLRGKITGGLAHQKPKEEPDQAQSRQDASGTTNPPGASNTPEDRWILTVRAKEAQKNGVLSR